jgi:hypothetical protein
MNPDEAQPYLPKDMGFEGVLIKQFIDDNGEDGCSNP